MQTSGNVSAPTHRDRLLQRGLWLEYITLRWNVVGVGVVAVAALAVHSVALAGFGLDSLIEILTSIVVAWQLTDTAGRRERTAMRCAIGNQLPRRLCLRRRRFQAASRTGPG